MKNTLVIYQLFNATMEEILQVINDYLGKLVSIDPEVSLSVSEKDVNSEVIWQGSFIVNRPWGTEDENWGYVEIKEKNGVNTLPIEVKLYCSDPKYIDYWMGLGITLKRNLPIFDEKVLPKYPYMLIPDHRNDQTILKLWLGGYTARQIYDQTGISPRTIYDRLRILRKKYGIKIVPKKRKNNKKMENS